MKPFSLLSLFVLPLLVHVHAQNSSISTSLTTYVTLASGRVESTVTSSILFTIIPSSSGNHSGTSVPSQSTGVNGTSNNSTSNATSSTSTGPLPTAPTNVDGGGSGGPNGGAPAPGQTGAGGIYGPNDGYTNAVQALNVKLLLGSMAGAIASGVLVLV